CLEAGMDDYISKPVQRAQLRKLLDQYHARKASHQHSISAKTETLVSSDREIDSDRAIDTAALMELCSGNLELIESLLDELESSGEMRVAHIREHADQGNARGVAEAAHSLKGATSILCAASLQQLSQEIEQTGTEDHLENIDALIDELSTEMQRCLRELPQVRADLQGMSTEGE
ncbi:MAG: Hpt domain-containing protein, partial [Gimesia chilikensis]